MSQNTCQNVIFEKIVFMRANVDDNEFMQIKFPNAYSCFSVFTGNDFTSASIQNGTFENTKFIQNKVNNLVCSETKFKNCYFESMDFRSVVFEGCNFSKCTFVNCEYTDEQKVMFGI